MKKFFDSPWAIGIIIFIIIRFCLGLAFDLRPSCHDGWHSSSIGQQGACSHHGGVDRTPASIAFFFSLLIAAIGGAYWNQYTSKDLSRRPKIILLDEDNSAAPECPSHGKMIAIINENGKSCWACKKYPECVYWLLRE